MINIAICDDSEIMLESISRQAISVIPQVCDFKIHKFTSGIELLNKINEGLRVDIAFLDISMPEIDGFTLAEKLKPYNTIIIFLTSHTEKVFDGYKYGAFRFIPKDNISGRLPEAILSALAQTSGQKQTADFKIRDRDSVITVPVCINDIIYFEYLLRNVTMYTASNSYKLFAKTLSELIQRLKPYDFMVVHRAYLINPEHIKCFKNTDIVMSNGDLIPIGSKKTQIDDIKKKYFMYLEKR